MASAANFKSLACNKVAPNGALHNLAEASDSLLGFAVAPTLSMFSARHGPTAQRITRESRGMKQSFDQKVGNYRNKTTKKHHVID
jgi:hypothetical protein